MNSKSSRANVARHINNEAIFFTSRFPGFYDQFEGIFLRFVDLFLCPEQDVYLTTIYASQARNI